MSSARAQNVDVRGRVCGSMRQQLSRCHSNDSGAFSPTRRPHSVNFASNWSVCDAASEIPALVILKTGPLESVVGSGKFGTPWERMHRASFRSAVSICCTRAGGQSLACMHSCSCCWSDPPVGNRCWQACWAAWYWEVLTPNCWASPLGSCPLLWASGKFGTPWERMQAEEATADGELADPPAPGEPPVDDGLPLHAAASRARP